MERYQKIFQNISFLIKDLTTSIVRLSGYSKDEIVDFASQLMACDIGFQSKILSYELMHRYTLKKSKQLEIIAREEVKQEVGVLTETSRAMFETIAFFEAYLNAFYSLLQIIAKLTPFFYKTDFPELTIPDRTFGSQVNFFRKHSNSPDSEYSSYIENKLWRWYEILKNNRHAITHRAAVFVGFGKEGRIVFLDPPKNGDKRYWIKTNKPHVNLENYLTNNFDSLFDFLDFYLTHFRKKVPESERTQILKKAKTR
ncbi:hypothetical protein AC480_01405 [miscellaneous Crenarchaeota group archaeon SMTZ1-55]|nr:MAG: hypothetical protein AC480_01405 [miscellaneous Crenarchaeota group archaeon SMTZ1-55]